MIKRYIKIHALKKLQHREVLHTLTLLCVVDTFLLASKQPVNVLSLNGNAALPYTEGKYTQRKLLKIIDSELPLLIYNAIICKDLELQDDVIKELNALEASLKRQMNNKWVKLLLKSAIKEVPISKDILLSSSVRQAQQLGTDRTQFNTYCSAHLNNLKKIFKGKEQCNLLCNWLNTKKSEAQL